MEKVIRITPTLSIHPDLRQRVWNNVEFSFRYHLIGFDQITLHSQMSTDLTADTCSLEKHRSEESVKSFELFLCELIPQCSTLRRAEDSSHSTPVPHVRQFNKQDV